MTKAAISGVVCASALFFLVPFFNPAHAWVKGYQAFPDGEATVVLYRFCRKADCGRVAQSDWQDAIQNALDEWNEAEANFRFRTRPRRSTDDPCRLSGEVAVILAEPGRLCPGDGPLPRGEISGRTEFPRGGGARVYINTEDFLFGWRQQGQILVNPVVTFLLHEFGHVVGLSHPDEAGQQVLAVMNADFGLFDNALFPDDIAGIQALYPHEAASGGVLESPKHGAHVSGLGFISGWKCEARRLTVRINKGRSILLASGQPRADTRPACGDTTNGFIAQINWNHLGEGTHTAVAYDDGVEFARSTFTVGSTGEEFLEGVTVSIAVPDFPAPGEMGRFVWNESTQHLELAEVREGDHSSQDPLAPFDGSWNLDAYGEQNCGSAPAQRGIVPQQGTVQVVEGRMEGRFESSGGLFSNIAQNHVLTGTVAASGQLRLDYYFGGHLRGWLTGVLTGRTGQGRFERPGDGGDPPCVGRWEMQWIRP